MKLWKKPEKIQPNQNQIKSSQIKFKLDNARSGLPIHPSQRLMYKAFEHSGSNWNLEVLVFEEREKPEYPGEVLVFEERGKLEYPRKTSRTRERTNNKLGPHMVRAQYRTRATSVGGECSHHCASPAPPVKLASMTCSSQGYLVTYSFLCSDFMLCSRLVGHDFVW